MNPDLPAGQFTAKAQVVKGNLVTPHGDEEPTPPADAFDADTMRANALRRQETLVALIADKMIEKKVAQQAIDAARAELKVVGRVINATKPPKGAATPKAPKAPTTAVDQGNAVAAE